MSDTLQHHPVSKQAYTVSLSETARTYVKQCMAKQNDVIGVYLTVNNDGCSGMSYVFDFVDSIPTDTIEFTEEGVTLFVAKKYLAFVDGTIIDYIMEELNKKIIFRNPKAQNTCGCGESFSVDVTT